MVVIMIEIRIWVFRLGDWNLRIENSNWELGLGLRIRIGISDWGLGLGIRIGVSGLI